MIKNMFNKATTKKWKKGMKGGGGGLVGSQVYKVIDNTYN